MLQTVAGLRRTPRELLGLHPSPPRVARSGRAEPSLVTEQHPDHSDAIRRHPKLANWINPGEIHLEPMSTPERLGRRPPDDRCSAEIHSPPSAQERTPTKSIAGTDNGTTPVLRPRVVRANQRRSGRTGIAPADRSDLAPEDPCSDALAQPLADLSAEQTAQKIVDHASKLTSVPTGLATPQQGDSRCPQSPALRPGTPSL